MTRFSSLCLALVAANCVALTFACNSSSTTPPIPLGDAAAGSPETPPTDGKDVEAWIVKGYYKTWHCEPAVHVARSPSPHGFDRVCSNDLVNPTATDPDAGAWPTGAAEVKELYTAVESDAGPAGYAVSLKVAADVPGDAGANWYWYERQVDQSIEADGLGTANSQANTICVSCHVAAGSGQAYTPSPGSRDFIYTPVP
ncbi:MAG: hypothetical protein ACLQVI_08910 [Polyangiaceae bacterium]